MSTKTKTPVLIVGGGIVGLTASLFLSHYGIESILVERHSGTSIHPRARSVNARTMELFRKLGIEDRAREAGATLSSTKGIHSGSSLKEVIEAKPRTQGTRKLPMTWLFESVSPVMGAFVTQDMLEPVLVETAKEQGVDVRFYSECVRIDQNNESVTTVVKDRETGAISTIHADYLIAADGAKSGIRSQLGIKTTGCGAMGHLLNILFHADLKGLVHQREFSLCKIDRPEVYGLFTSINNNDRWAFHLSYDPSKGEKASDYTPERCKELLRFAIGIPHIEIDVKSILPWEPSVNVAERLQEGRVFLAGDAAHQMPPWGGQGANSGIADVHNLSWKLAAVLNGEAPAALLGTYDTERLPVGREAAESSATGVDKQGMISMKMELAVIRGWVRKIPLISGHGYGYASPAICEEIVAPLGGWTWRPWTVPSLGFAIDGRPGRRAPHVWVENEGKRISTLDLFGKGFVLLAGADGACWLEAAQEVSSKIGIKITGHCIGAQGDLVAQPGAFEAAAGISSRGAILVRPDDFVVWRERRKSNNCRENLVLAMKTALCL